MSMPDTIYAKRGKKGIIYSTVKIKEAVEYIRSDKVAAELRKLLVALETKSETVLNKMKDVLG